MRMKLILALLVSIACLSSATTLLAKSDAANNGSYTTKDQEYYLTPEQLLFIRPGLELEIMDVVIPADRQPEVTFKLTDPAGLVLDRTGVNTPGPVSTSWILAYIPAGEEAYYSYTSRIQTSPITGDSAEQASSDSGGTYTDMGDYVYMYKFGTVLPEGYDMDATHTLGVYARRDLTEFELDRYVTNELEHFVPSGSAAPVPRDIVTNETCNGRCHDPLAMHGGARQAIGLCVLCHNPFQEIDPDTGNSVDMPLMIHKIHMGAGLENGYNIIGYRQSNHDYSDVVYPANVNECESCHTGGTPTENFPMVATPSAALVCDASAFGETTLTWEHTGYVEIKVRTPSNPDGSLFAQGGPSGSQATGKWVGDGTVFDIYDQASGDLLQSVPVNATVLGCVSNAPGTARGLPGAQHTNWLDHPTRKECGSCHDGIDWVTGDGHSDNNIPQDDDDRCAQCHRPYSEFEFDRTVKNAHMELYKSAQLPGVVVEFLDIVNTGPGENPTVTFALKGKNRPLNPSEMDRLRFVLSGPNTDFDFYEDETVGGNAVQVGDNWTYTFETALPDDASGSYMVSMEGRIEADVNYGGGEIETERDYAENPYMAFAVTDATAVPRRVVVDDAKCESCHVNLRLHGGNRHDPQYCNTCHMPSLLDRGPDLANTEAENVSMKWMIHKIHRGAELENGYVVYRSRGTYDFSNIHYTGDLRNCDACHVNNSQQLPLPSGLLPTITLRTWWNPTMPEAAACLSCHDDDSSAAHAYANTTSFGESCSTCHGEGKTYSVDKVHAR